MKSGDIVYLVRLKYGKLFAIVKEKVIRVDYFGDTAGNFMTETGWHDPMEIAQNQIQIHQMTSPFFLGCQP